MKYCTAQLIAARPEKSGNEGFIARTMHAIQTADTHATFPVVLHEPNIPLRKRLYMRVKGLPTAALVALIIASAVGLSGVVYASIRFAPDFIKILNKSTNNRGATEYSVPDFAKCATDYGPVTEKFELKKDAPRLSDEEIKKTIQARCELAGVNDFVAKAWPTFGTHKDWQDGDDIFYTRPDLLGTLQSASADKAAMTYYGGQPQTKTYDAQPGQNIVAFAGGAKIPISQLKPGDTVFTVVRVTETYHKTWTNTSNPNPRPQGLVAIIKLSLPNQYYGTMQQYLTELPACAGNPGEYCPNTPSIDVFPRIGGEGATNPLYKNQPGYVFREVTGTVTQLDADSLVLKSHSGKKYTARVPANAFTTYNTDYAPNYTDIDATLQIGSTVSIIYSQPPKADARTITPEQITRINLLLDGLQPKQGGVKQY